MVLEKTLENPLDCKEIQPVHPKGDQSWVFIGRTDVEAETPIFWPPDEKSWLIGKDPDAGEDWGQEKGTTGDEMVGWHHQLDGHGFGWTPGVGDGQGGLACCSSWGRKESDMTEQLNWTEPCKPSFHYKSGMNKYLSFIPFFPPFLNMTKSNYIPQIKRPSVGTVLSNFQRLWHSSPEHWIWSQTARVPTVALPITSCVTLRKLFNLSVPHFSHL